MYQIAIHLFVANNIMKPLGVPVGVLILSSYIHGHAAQKKIGLKHKIMKLITLKSEINVLVGINIQVGRFGRNYYSQGPKLSSIAYF